MKKFLFISIFVLALCIASFAQTNTNPLCPTISVSGPAGIVEPNEVARYRATVDTKGQKLDLTYIWSVNVGKILSGQGTLTIEVKQPESESLTVTIEVNGVPKGCPNSASETASICLPPQPVKLAQFDGATFAGDMLELNKIAREMNDNPNDQLYVYFAYKQEPAGKPEVDYLAAAIGDRSRITVVRLFEGADLVQFWRVPPGADNPVCKECDLQIQCPTVSVIGPAGIVQPGDLYRFTASVEPEVLSVRNMFEWTITGGKIVGRTDTKTMEVQPEKYFNKTTTASVKINGLPDGCPNTATESGGAVCDPYVVVGAEVSFWTQYSGVTWQEERMELDSLATGRLNRHPRHVIYLEKMFRKDMPQQAVDYRISQITNYFIKVRKLSRNRFFVRASRGNSDRTNGYLVPRDAPVLDRNYQDPCLQ